MRPRISNLRPLTPIYWPPILQSHFFSTTSPLSSTKKQQKVSDPLRILFCGSDAFSIAALKALHREHENNDALIRSLHVVVRPPKPTGRGMKVLREVPLKTAALDLGLPIHELDTFTGWTPSFDINLIVAVSFGLLVPPRLLRLAKYGGLNVHPSLLPDLRGPAPLHHTLLNRLPTTGVTLQTLHERKFDHGTILSQTPPPGVPVPAEATLQSLHELVTPLAADMLVCGLREGLHVPPRDVVGSAVAAVEPDAASATQAEAQSHSLTTLRHAPKVTKRDRNVQWGSWTANDFATYQRVLGELWSEARVPEPGPRSRPGGGLRDGEANKMRVIFENVEVVPPPHPMSPPAGYISWLWTTSAIRKNKETNERVGEAEAETAASRETKMPYFDAGDGSGAVLMPAASGGDWVRVGRVKVPGKGFRPAAGVIAAFATGGKREESR